MNRKIYIIDVYVTHIYVYSLVTANTENIFVIFHDNIADNIKNLSGIIIFKVQRKEIIIIPIR